jgi:hypothetical protein
MPASTPDAGFQLRASFHFGQLIFHRQLPRAKALQLVAFELRAVSKIRAAHKNMTVV